MTSSRNKIVNLNLHNGNDRVLDFSDFQKQTIQFDIDKLQDAYNQIIKIKKFEDAGVTNFGAISLTQIPGDPDSITGNKARGVYWTKPDKSGKEVSRDVNIDESQYSEFIKDFVKVAKTLQNAPENTWYFGVWYHPPGRGRGFP